LKLVALVAKFHDVISPVLEKGVNSTVPSSVLALPVVGDESASGPPTCHGSLPP
jgi:hypothetical protein